MKAIVLVETLWKRGISLSLVAGRLEVRPASALTNQDRADIRAYLPDIIAALTPTDTPACPSESLPVLPAREPWNQREALRLMFEADALTERLGVDGREPAIVDAAAMVVSAFATPDMETLRFAVSQFVVLIRRLARERLAPAGSEHEPPNPNGQTSLVGHRQHQQLAGTIGSVGS